jgi:hypothetical protein
MTDEQVSAFFSGEMGAFFQVYKILKASGVDFKTAVIVSAPTGEVCACGCGRKMLMFRSATREQFVLSLGLNYDEHMIVVFDRIRDGRQVSWVHFTSLTDCGEVISCAVTIDELEQNVALENSTANISGAYRVN